MVYADSVVRDNHCRTVLHLHVTLFEGTLRSTPERFESRLNCVFPKAVPDVTEVVPEVVPEVIPVVAPVVGPWIMKLTEKVSPEYATCPESNVSPSIIL